MDNREKLLCDLKSFDAEKRKRATRSLWSLWFSEAGEKALYQIKKGTELIDKKKLCDAEDLLIKLIEEYPDFAEAHNKLATVMYLMGRFKESIDECKIALKINPIHFGAWNGLGLCLFNLGQYEEAMQGFEKALEIQPYANINRVYIARCRGNLN
tara:strand:+ start:286 stop:750 length:465 start_codon:yes stop_codon:yes gene_type:complete